MALVLSGCLFPACSGADSGAVPSPSIGAGADSRAISDSSTGSVEAVTLDQDPPDVVSAPDAAGTSLPGDGPCALVTTAEVSDSTGQVMNDGASSVVEAGDVCEWISTESSASEDVRSPMKVAMTVGDLVPGAAEVFDEYDSPGRGVGVEGLGDDAVILCGLAADVGPGCDSYGALVVIVGDRFLSLEMSNFAWPEDLTQDQVRDGLEAVARLALSRL